jgi:hypothetical protein
VPYSGVRKILKTSRLIRRLRSESVAEQTPPSLIVNKHGMMTKETSITKSQTTFTQDSDMALHIYLLHDLNSFYHSQAMIDLLLSPTSGKSHLSYSVLYVLYKAGKTL